jgi:hypothetical protein
MIVRGRALVLHALTLTLSQRERGREESRLANNLPMP